MKYKIAMFGAGKIAYKIADAIAACDDRIVRYGVASRNKAHAEIFADVAGFGRIYDSYEELLKDKEIDFVYISTPTQMHYEHIKMCLHANKNVICEKPFALNYSEAKELLDLAEAKQLICMDAMWSMYMPMWQKISEITEKKELGNIKLLFASFGYPNLHIERLLDKNGGGSFYDLGVYCVTAAKKVLGNQYFIKKVRFKYFKGVDVVNRIVMKMNNCKVSLHSSIKYRTSYMLGIIGTRGMLLSRKFWTGNSFYYWKYPFSIKKHSFLHDINGYEHELKEMLNLLDSKKNDSSKWGHKDTLDVIACMDEIRKKQR